MKNRKNGITLISLVITIVIMLIIAGVSINLIIGDNGLFKKFIFAKQKSENAQDEENSLMVGYEDEIDKVTKKGPGITMTKAQYDQIANSRKWQYLGSASANVPIDILGIKCNTLFVKAYQASLGSVSTMIPADMYKDGEYYEFMGSRIRHAIVDCTNTEVKLTYYSSDTTNLTTSSYIYVYYK